jgi:hypothetical protein
VPKENKKGGIKLEIPIPVSEEKRGGAVFTPGL